MIDRLLDTALVGTAQRGDQPLPTDLPVAGLVAQLPALGQSRQLLLAAGAQALYARAGRELGFQVPAGDESPPDRLAPCSQAAARTIDQLLREDRVGVLPEALERLRRAGLRLPHHLLVPALDAGRAASYLRGPLRPTLDARGTWLARKNPDWSWAAGGMVETDTLPNEAETIWQEGLPSERLAILRAQRAADPALARSWLAAVWKGEKADFRAPAIGSFTVGLSLDDEPFLEAALDDRSQGVRDEAVRLLTGLPGSALARRMRDRADQLLDYRPQQRSLLRSITQAFGGAKGTLLVSPPTGLVPTWQRDGIAPKPPYGVGEQAWWLQSVIAAIPPTHWSQRFAAAPGDLIAAARSDEWGEQVIAGWALASRHAPDPDWLRALWDHWSGKKDNQRGRRDERIDLLRAMPPEMAFAVVEPIIEDARRHPETIWQEMAAAIPKPWSDHLARQFLDVARERIVRFTKLHYDPLVSTLPIAAVALPPSAFDAALIEWQLPAGNDWWIAQRQRQIDEFTATIALRRRLMEEIPL